MGGVTMLLEIGVGQGPTLQDVLYRHHADFVSKSGGRTNESHSVIALVETCTVSIHLREWLFLKLFSYAFFFIMLGAQGSYYSQC